MPSIIIPAHQEAESIGGLLTGLEPLAGEIDVVVVCNGCTDNTAEIAGRVAPWARILEIPVGSKPAALNLGDAGTTAFPRLYLDADVVIAAVSVQRLFEALDAVPGLVAVAATPLYDASSSSLTVRSYQRFWEKLPANRRGLAGTNAMAVTRSGRERFGTWPDLIGDDYFLDGLFSDSEKTRVTDAVISRPVSRGFLGCISRKSRVHQGNRDVQTEGLRPAHAGGGVGGVLTVLRNSPAAITDLPAYVLVTVSSRVLSWWRRRRGTSDVWFRDRL
ncbi:hypothetical protein GCM10022223_06110 [Kineosporia mesophila]|uniref:4,4'-diaponeurosporenoate glycosyltransferase n=1 Tax=Kineosporia mesophila TaxID=566012 RepID=A0ABP6YZG6_9ACTN|nr:glycosyltransferase [Kineosporia mesophila]